MVFSIENTDHVKRASTISAVEGTHVQVCINFTKCRLTPASEFIILQNQQIQEWLILPTTLNFILGDKKINQILINRFFYF